MKPARPLRKPAPRNPKTRRPKEIRKPKSEPGTRRPGSSDLELRPSFGFRPSEFGLPGARVFHPRTVLVGVETARALLGVDADAVQARIDAGRLRWVWDISARPHGRERGRCKPVDRDVPELRLWVRELLAPDLFDGLPLRQVLPLVLGRERPRWRSSEVAQLLLCSRPAMKRLAEAGELAGSVRAGIRWFNRAALSAFLARRLLRPSRRAGN